MANRLDFIIKRYFRFFYKQFSKLISKKQADLFRFQTEEKEVLYKLVDEFISNRRSKQHSNNASSANTQQLEFFLFLQNALKNELGKLSKKYTFKLTHARSPLANLMLARQKINEQISALRKSCLFDTEYYLCMYPDVRTSGIDPLEHYVKYGAFESRTPCPLFDPDYYAMHTVIPAFVTPLYHYLTSDNRKKSNPHPLFWDYYYCNQMNKAKRDDCLKLCKELTPLGYYMKHGYKETFNTHPLFDQSYYLNKVTSKGKLRCDIPLLDYITSPHGNRVDPHPLFSESFYYQNSLNLDKSVNPLIHYLKHGWKEEKSPHLLFDVRMYLRTYPRIVKAGLDPITYYLCYGWEEGHWPNQVFDTDYYCGLYTADKRVHENPLIDYVLNDTKQRRSTAFFFDPDYYRTQTKISDEERELDHFLSKGIKFGISAHPSVPSNLYYETADLNSVSLVADIHKIDKSVYGLMPPFIHSSNKRTLLRELHKNQKPVSNVKDKTKLITKRDGTTWKVAWYLPKPLEGSGGHRTILESAQALSDKGFECDVYVDMKGEEISDVSLSKMMLDWFGNFDLTYIPHTEIANDYDAYFATLWSSPSLFVSLGLPIDKCFYFVQDFEPWFHPMSFDYMVAENSYKLNFKIITIGFWLPEKLKKSFGITNACGFPFGAEKDKYFRMPDIQRTKSISFIYQPNKYRRAAKLGLQALELVKKDFPDVAVYLYGSRIRSSEFKFSHMNLGMLKEEDCNLLYNMSSVGVCFSLSNPSRLPFEMMTTGLPVVELNGDNTHFDYPQNGVVLAEFDPKDISKKIINLLTDDDYWNKHSHGALEFMKDRSRENERECFVAIVLKHLKSINTKSNLCIGIPNILSRYDRDYCNKN